MTLNAPTITTGALLGLYYKDLISGGIPDDTAREAVLLAAKDLTREGDLAVSKPVAA